MVLDPIGQVFQQLERQPRWRSRGQFRRVLNRWPAIVGETVARQAAPVRLEHGLLHVAVANPMWAQTLTLERLTILGKLNQQLQLELNDIRFSSGNWYRRKASPPQPNTIKAQLPQWLTQHPSFEAGAVSSPLPRPQTPEESFQRWSTLTQRLTAHRPLCPCCHSPCPSGELTRWGRCSLCAGQGFKSPSQPPFQRRLFR
jgi:predicted nucleic acid-binding Zn ribbon protein